MFARFKMPHCCPSRKRIDLDDRWNKVYARVQRNCKAIFLSLLLENAGDAIQPETVAVVGQLLKDAAIPDRVLIFPVVYGQSGMGTEPAVEHVGTIAITPSGLIVFETNEVGTLEGGDGVSIQVSYIP